MKKNILLLMILSVFCYSCQEDYIGQYPTDSIPPAPVSNVRVDNQPGRAVIHYDLPDVSDMMGVKAKYVSPTTGKAEEMFSSAYVNFLTLKGFGHSQPIKVTLVAIDNSYNESSPVTVEIQPEDSPIYEIINTMDIQESFGGLKLAWNNEIEEGVSIVVQKKDEEGNYVDLDIFYSSLKSDKRTVRGLGNEPTDFAFYCSDYYGNTSEVLYKTMTPLFEEHLDKTKFKLNDLDLTKYPYHSYGGKNMANMWNDKYNTAGDLFYVQNTSSDPVEFSFDLGVTAKLSRFRMWTRSDYIYRLHHVRTFELWSTTDPAVSASGASWDGWEYIGTFESIRPSGATEGGTPTADEIQFVKDGEEWEFESEPVVRWLRYKILSTWGNSTFCFINEVDFWGKVLD